MNASILDCRLTATILILRRRLYSSRDDLCFESKARFSLLESNSFFQIETCFVKRFWYAHDEQRESLSLSLSIPPPQRLAQKAVQRTLDHLSRTFDAFHPLNVFAPSIRKFREEVGDQERHGVHVINRGRIVRVPARLATRFHAVARTHTVRSHGVVDDSSHRRNSSERVWTSRNSSERIKQLELFPLK